MNMEDSIMVPKDVYIPSPKIMLNLYLWNFTQQGTANMTNDPDYPSGLSVVTRIFIGGKQ